MDLVTGGTGLVGSHVLLELLQRGGEVRATHRSGSDRTLVRRVFNFYSHDGDALYDRIQWLEADVLDVSALYQAMQGMRHAYHCAALVSFDPRDTRRLFAVNIGGTANVVNAALAAGVARLVHVSSTAATGRSSKGKPVDEAVPWVQDRNTSPYAVSKQQAELEIRRGIAEGMDAVIVNPSVVFGAGAEGKSSLKIVEPLRRGTSFYPNGSNGYVDARDVAFAMVELCPKGKTGERYLLSGDILTYRELFTCLAKAFAQRPPRRELKPWMLALAWRLERMRSLLTGSPGMVTRYSAHSATSHYRYVTQKVQDTIGITFRPANEAIINAVKFLQSGAADH